MGETDDIKSEQHFYTDWSFWSLLIANIITMVWALKESWSLSLLIWVYFSQNIILGFFWLVKVFDSIADGSYTRNVSNAIVFLLHYLPIHFLYGIVLCQSDLFGKELLANFKYILAMGGIFFLSEIISYFAGSMLNRAKPLNLATVQLLPYARILPMHFVMFVGIGFEVRSTNPHLIVVVFLLLKAFADIAMYLVERHSLFGNLVTDLFEKHTDWSDLPDNLKAKLEVCRFCQRVIVRNGTRAIKDPGVCTQCYQKIEKEVASQKREGKMTIDE